MKRLRRIGIILCCMVLLTGYAQDNYQQAEFEPARIDEAQWQETTQDRDYYERSEPKPVETKKSKEIATPFDWKSISWLVYLLIGVLVLFVVYLLVQVISAKQNTRLSSTQLSYQRIEELEENLDKADLDHFLQQALAEGNYRLAIRIMYLMMLQAMQAKDWIDYRKDKTNFNYVMEMNGRPEGREFTRLTRAFELIWYGDIDFGQQHYERLRRPFSQYLETVKQND